MMVFEQVLRIKNLPKELTDSEKEEFAQHFGAVQVKVVNISSSKKAIVYAKFETKEIAKAVLVRLHQFNVFNSRLCVEYAEQDIGHDKPVIKKIEQVDNKEKKYFKNFICKLNSFNNSVGFHQPPPPHLKYVYPKANRPTINNIAHAIATIPKFYTQVLHLMNRMNLPPPFAILEQPQIRPQIPTVQQKNSLQQVAKSKSSSESEIESDVDAAENKEIIPQKRRLPQKKGIKRPKFIKPNIKQNSSSKAEKSEDVFDKVDLHTNRKIELKVASDSLEKIESGSVQPPGIIGVISTNQPATVEENLQETASKKNSIISDEDLKSNQIPLKDLEVLPVFKNYHPGKPTCRLYVKNIAKNVNLEDLEYIYNRYKLVLEHGKPSVFDIRLMQEGRMKGQAFITVDNIEIAQKALTETNGFILKDKPLVVVYARSVVQKT